jgi:ankyrin repeat protein
MNMSMNNTDIFIRAIKQHDLASLGTLTHVQVNALDEGGRSLLMHAVLAQPTDVAVVRLLIERGADVDFAEGKQKWTALHVAARDQQEEIVRALLNAGATVDVVDAFGNTPLWRSVMNTSTNLATAVTLCEAGANPDYKNKSGVSAADLARESAQPEKVAFLRRCAAHREQSGSGLQSTKRPGEKS